MMSRLVGVQGRIEANRLAAEALSQKKVAPAGKGKGSAPAKKPAPPPKPKPGAKAKKPPKEPVPRHPPAPDAWHFTWGRRAYLGAGMSCASVEVQLMYKTMQLDLQDDESPLPSPRRSKQRPSTAPARAPSSSSTAAAAANAAAGADNAAGQGADAPAAQPAANQPPSPDGPTAGTSGRAPGVIFQEQAGATSSPFAAASTSPFAAGAAQQAAAGARGSPARKGIVKRGQSMMNLKALLSTAGLESAASTVHEGTNVAPLFRSGRVRDPLLGNQETTRINKWDARKAAIENMGGYSNFETVASRKKIKSASGKKYVPPLEDSPALVKVALAMSKIKAANWLAAPSSHRQ